MSVRIEAIEGLPEVRPGDDVAALLEGSLRSLGAADGDVVAVTQKIVSKAEGRLIHDEDRAAVVARETVRVVAERDDLVIAETAHGFVCANAGVDASNVDAGWMTLLPEDPDASARRLRERWAASLGLQLGVVITDTFGRPWRNGVLSVAIGCAGLPAVIDLRGTPDHTGRQLDATVVAFADEVAAASGLVMTKAARLPAALIRGLEPDPAPVVDASSLVRPAQDDLFRESPLQALHARRTIRSFGPDDVPRQDLEAAIGAACTAPAPHHTRPWRFTVLRSRATKRKLLAAMGEAWRADLRRDGTDEAVIDRRIAKSDAVLGEAPVLIVPWLSFAGSHTYGDAERAHAEQEMFLLSGGAAIQTLLLALNAHGIASCWISSTLFCQEETREALGMQEGWFALGAVACGQMRAGSTIPPRPPIDPLAFAEFL